MAKTNLLDTSTRNLLELIGNGVGYRVPVYQRDYSWEQEQWEDLWNDIVELGGNRDDFHYMGALVVEARSDREFLVIDGQQRLATLSILALAVIGHLQKMVAAGIDPQANQERALALRNRFIGEKDPASLVERSKLVLNGNDIGIYQDYLVQLRSPYNPKALPRSNRLLWDCFQFFVSRLVDHFPISQGGEPVATMLAETVGRQLMFILIKVDDELNAYTVFETLNARGLELSSTDLLKNYLFSRVRVPAELEALQRRWQSLIATVRQERFPDFLRYHLLCEQPRVRSQRLFKLVRDKIRGAPDVFSLLDALERRAELFSALVDPEHEFWIERPSCKKYIREITLFRSRQPTPLLFAAWEKMSPVEFEKLLKLVGVITFRYSVVAALNTNALEPTYHEAARALLADEIGTAKEVFECLRPIYVPDDRFERDFEALELQTGGQGKKVARYILARLEGDASGRQVDIETDPATIEHILPENPSENWNLMFPQSRWTASIYRLGNLTLLTATDNRRVGNMNYAQKVEVYEGSSYQLTRNVAEMAPEDWTPARLDDRQKRLARRAVHLWRADVA